VLTSAMQSQISYGKAMYMLYRREWAGDISSDIREQQ
jgi:hypothetical protein